MKTSASSDTSIRKVAIASFIGTTIEWYDFFLYGTASALVFARLFFPKYDAMTGVMASYSTYAVGFIARPIGGIVCGHFGDRIGRKSMLIFTLSLMGVATALIGLLPTYDQIGVWAPALLIVLRIAQGFAVGGEWGGAVLMAVEHSPKGRRGFYGSWPQVGVPVGLLLAIPTYGWLSDKLGRRPVYLFGAIFTGLFAFPFFWLVETSKVSLMTLAIVVALVGGHSAMYGPQASFFSELFGTRVRYSGASLGYQLASVIAGGLSPIIAAKLLQRTGVSWPIALFVVGMAVVTTVSVFLAMETAHGEIAAKSDVRGI